MNRPGQPQRPPQLGNPSPNPTAMPPNTNTGSTTSSGTGTALSAGGPGLYRGQYPFTATGGLPQRSLNLSSSGGVLQTGQYGGVPGLVQRTSATTTTFLGQQQPVQRGFGGFPQQPATQTQQQDVGLDPNDFPALGSTTNANNSSSSNNNSNPSAGGASYASQAGTTLNSGSGTGGGGGGSGPRDFTPDDFPALGGGATSGSSQPSQNQNNNHSQTPQQQPETTGHPPGLNGFDHRQVGAGLLSVQQQQQQQQSQQPQQQPGMINIAQLGFDEKRRLKPNASSAAWLNAPPIQPQQQQNGATTAATNAFPSNGLSETPQQQPGQQGTNPSPTQAHPQTPAQQILMSPADRWGLLGLLAILKAASTTDVDHGLSSIGTDLGTMGLDMEYPGSLYNTFITPWSDQSSAAVLHSIEPNWSIPSCYYDVRPPAAGPAKMEAFSDETLFFIFYSHPRDALQEIAAQELYNRAWRFHKSMRIWISKEGAQLIKTLPGNVGGGSIGEVGFYTYWDVEGWTRERKEMSVLYNELEEKGNSVFPHAQTLEQSKAILTAQAQVQAAAAQRVY